LSPENSWFAGEDDLGVIHLLRQFKSQPFDLNFYFCSLISCLKRSRQISFKGDLTAMMTLAHVLLDEAPHQILELDQ
jgi:hypothetical protein